MHVIHLEYCSFDMCTSVLYIDELEQKEYLYYCMPGLIICPSCATVTDM